MGSAGELLAAPSQGCRQWWFSVLLAEGVASNAPSKPMGEAELFSGGCYDVALQRCHAPRLD